MIFDPADPGPARPPAPPRAAAERITRAPWQMPSRATCRAHQTFDDACGRCSDAIAERTRIRSNETTRYLRRLTSAPGR